MIFTAITNQCTGMRQDQTICQLNPFKEASANTLPGSHARFAIRLTMRRLPSRKVAMTPAGPWRQPAILDGGGVVVIIPAAS